MPAGYSGTPLAKKLGIKEGATVLAIGAPADYKTLLAPLPTGVRFATRLSRGIDLVHIFSLRRAELAQALERYRATLAPDAIVWVSWPKQSAKIPTEVTENVIRELALPLGWVDIKVCAIDATWSGLKLVVRRELR
ncbi:MAG: DUF3052 domain-containing protein [Candidatus Eisenbacteria bacterium]